MNANNSQCARTSMLVIGAEDIHSSWSLWTFRQVNLTGVFPAGNDPDWHCVTIGQPYCKLSRQSLKMKYIRSREDTDPGQNTYYTHQAVNHRLHNKLIRLYTKYFFDAHVQLNKYWLTATLQLLLFHLPLSSKLVDFVLHYVLLSTDDILL